LQAEEDLVTYCKGPFGAMFVGLIFHPLLHTQEVLPD
jgi:hypothetical protein